MKVKMEKSSTFHFVDSESLELISKFSSYVQIHNSEGLPPDKGDPVLYCDDAGHQRAGVVDNFYKEIENDLETTNIETVKRIYELTQPHLRSLFKRNFIDNWDNERSFVYVSW